MIEDNEISDEKMKLKQNIEGILYISMSPISTVTYVSRRERADLREASDPV